MFKVVVENLEEEFEVSSHKSFIDSVEDLEYPIRFGCKEGKCGSCMIRIVEGLQNFKEPSFQESALLEELGANMNERLACQCRVIGNVIISTDIL